MIIEHNSRMDFYRTPFGAVGKSDKIGLRLSLKDAGIPDSIKVILNFRDKSWEENLCFIMNLGEYCVYETEIAAPDMVGLLWYYFKVTLSGRDVFYGNNGEMLGGIGEIYENNPKPYQITVYDKDFSVPKWFSGSVMYQIFPDRFYNANKDGEFLGNRQDIIKRRWGETPFYKKEQFGGEYLANDFFGGNLKGIAEKLPYLHDLGIDVIYLNPIFRAYSNHRYDTGNYKEIDETLGTEKDFIALTEKAEEYGIKIILDGVFNHTGSNSIYFNKNGEYESVGAYQSRESQFYDWYNFTAWPDGYDSWWGIKTLPNVNENSNEYRDYILRDNDAVVKYWLKRGALGWRLDVVDELPDDFVKILRREVKKENPDAVIIGEVWEDASNKESYGERREYFLGEELDSVMNYPLKNAIIDIALGRISAEKFDQRIMSLKENYPRDCFYSLMNFLSSHDVERILTVMADVGGEIGNNKDRQAEFNLWGGDYERARERVMQIIMFIMLMPGVPSIYYGDEIGMQGFRDPFSRGTYNWEGGDETLRDWYKKAISLRKSSKTFRWGEFENVYKYENGYGYIRYDSDEKHIVLANFSDEEKCFRVDLSRFKIFELSGETFDEKLISQDGIYYVNMPRRGIKVFRNI